MLSNGHASDVEIVLHFTCRCRLSSVVLKSRPREASQYVLCSIDANTFALCRVAAMSSHSGQQAQVDISVTLQRDSQTFHELQSSLLAHNCNTNNSVTFICELQWVPRVAVRAAVAVTLELLPSSKSELLHDAEIRSLLQQTIQRHFILCADAIVKLPTFIGLKAKSRGELSDEQEQVMTFRVVSTYPTAPFVSITPSTRVTLTESINTREVDSIDIDVSKKTISNSYENTEVKIGGMENERTALRELILLPVMYPRLRSDFGVEFPKGVLLCGPPGVGKTLLVRSVVHECRQIKDASGATLDLNLQVINGSEIMTSGRGDAEHALRATFETALIHASSAQHAASVIFIDELDALCPKREGAGGASASHSRIVAQLLTLLDGVESGLSRENVVIAAATNLPNSIDTALRRPGRFDREIFVGPPNTALRRKIFQTHLYQTPIALNNSTNEEQEKHRDEFLDILAAKALGYVGADIAALCREATMVASTLQLVALSRDRDLEEWWMDWKSRVEPLRDLRSTPAKLGPVVAGRAWHNNPMAIIPLWFLIKKSSQQSSDEGIEKYKQQSHSDFFSFLLGRTEKYGPCNEKEPSKTFQVTMADFDQAMQTIVPSALRSASGYTKDFERQGWDSIGGQAETKLALQQALEWPVKYPQTFSRLGVKAPRGVLLYGPPGCSKSSIVRAAAHSSGVTFLSLSAAQVFSPYFGDAEAAVRQVFRDARAALPAIVFFDEIDVIVSKREFDGSGEGGTSTAIRVLSTMLNEMDGVESADGLLVIGATNRPDCIDAALLRPGRFDRILFVDLPSEIDRAEILRIHSRPMPLSTDIDFSDLARRTPYFSGAELENLCREAALLALRESLEAERVTSRHFEEALAGITPISSKESMTDYFTFAERLGQLS
ncbi:putative AAA+ ATPase domain, ATPase, AAA-type, core, AAA ATPase, AAA+ lid domain-containing protein [Plasmopara halstedii]